MRRLLPRKFGLTFETMRRLDHWLARVPGRRDVFVLCVCACIGVVSGYGAIAFRMLIDLISSYAFPGGIEIASLRAAPWYAVVLPPAIGGVMVSMFVTRVAPEARGHGVPEVIDACAQRGGRIRPRVAFAKILASAVSIASGGSVGREGPIVQIGSAAASSIGQALHLKGRDLKDLVAAGAAGGIAATFNAPVAGALFASEVLLGQGSPQRFSRLIVASVIATVIAHIHLGNAPSFSVPPVAAGQPWELGLYVGLGLLAAIVGVAFTRGLYFLEDLWLKVPLPIGVWGLFGGLIIGLVGLKLPHVLGVGYEVIDDVLNGTGMAATIDMATIGLLLLVIVGKIFATGTTIGSGGSGGVFAPSLLLGACTGAAFAMSVVHYFAPGGMAPVGTYALIGMGAVVAATTHAPITAVIIVFELTRQHEVLLPLLLSCTLAAVLARWFNRESIYSLKLVRRGVTRYMGHEAAVATSTSVTAVADPVDETLPPDAPLELIIHRAVDLHHNLQYVVDDDGSLLGVITTEEIKSIIRDHDALAPLLVAADLMHPPGGTLQPDDTLEHCVALFSLRWCDELPVVDDGSRLLGRVTRASVFALYNREILRQETMLTFVDEDEDGRQESGDRMVLRPGELKARIDVGGALARQTLKGLDLRNRHGVNVYAVDWPDRGPLPPDPDAELPVGAVLLAIGPQDGIDAVRKLATQRASTNGAGQ